MRRYTKKEHVKLTANQKKALLEWMAEGLDRREINLRAGAFTPPFQVKRQQIYYFSRNKQPLNVDQLLGRLQASARAAGYDIPEEQIDQLRRSRPCREKM